MLRDSFERELAPHFAVEEELLLPALRLAGQGALCERVEQQHAFIRQAAALAVAVAGDAAAAHSVSTSLHDHVRIEERVFSS